MFQVNHWCFAHALHAASVGDRKCNEDKTSLTEVKVWQYKRLCIRSETSNYVCMTQDKVAPSSLFVICR